MIARFFNFSKRKNSTKRPNTETGTDITVRLKDNTSLENPVFIIQGKINDNYNYINWNWNFYFVNDVVQITNDIVEYHCSMDALATFKTEIGNYTCFVERCADENHINNLIKDVAIQQVLDTYTEINTSNAISDLIPTDAYPGHSSPTHRGSFVYGVLGTAGIERMCDIRLGALNEVFNMSNYSFGDTDELAKAIINPTSYIIDVKWIPCNYTFLTDNGLPDAHLNFGFWSSSGVTYNHDHRIFSGENTLSLPTNPYNDFRKYDDEFSIYTIHLPGVGDVKLENSFIDTPIKLQYMIDTWTGFIQYRLFSGSGNNGFLIGSYTGDLSIPIQLGSRNQNAGQLNGIIQQTSAGASAIGSALRADFGGAIGGIMNEATAGLNAKFQWSSTLNGSNGTPQFDYAVYVSLKTYKSAGSPRTTQGKPCYKNLQLNYMSGYIKCNGASISIAGTESERTTINNYLNGGFYYE